MIDLNTIIFGYLYDGNFDDAIKYKDIFPDWKTHITKLDLGGGKYTKFSSSLKEFSNLIELNISGNDLYQLPALPKRIKILDCSHNNLTNLNTIKLLPLTHLYCEYNNLIDIPLYPKLEYLTYGNRFISDKGIHYNFNISSTLHIYASDYPLLKTLGILGLRKFYDNWIPAGYLVKLRTVDEPYYEWGSKMEWKARFH